MAGLIVHPLSRRPGPVLHRVSSLSRGQGSGRSCACWAVMRKAQPLPFPGPPALPHGGARSLSSCHCGEPSAPFCLSPLRLFLFDLLADLLRSFAHGRVSCFPSLLPLFPLLILPFLIHYWSRQTSSALSDGPARRRPGRRAAPARRPSSNLHRPPAADQPRARGATAYPHRDVEFVMNCTRAGPPSDYRRAGFFSFRLRCPLSLRDCRFLTVPSISDYLYAYRVAWGAYRANTSAGARQCGVRPGTFRMNQNVTTPAAVDGSAGLPPEPARVFFPGVGLRAVVVSKLDVLQCSWDR